MPGLDQEYGRPDIEVIGEAGPSGIRDNNSEPATKKRRFEGGAYNTENHEDSYNITCRDSKSLKGKLFFYKYSRPSVITVLYVCLLKDA